MDHMVVLFFNFLRKLCAVFHSGYIILNSHQQCIKGPKSPHPHQLPVPSPSYIWFFKLFSTLGATPIFSPDIFFLIQLENSSSAAYNHGVLIDTQTLLWGRVLFAHFKHLLLFLWSPGQKHIRNAIHILGSLMFFSKDLFSIRTCDLDTASKHTECKI